MMTVSAFAAVIIGMLKTNIASPVIAINARILGFLPLWFKTHNAEIVNLFQVRQ
jgi:hypothetical protein